MNSASAYVFVRSGPTWSQQAVLVPSDVDPIDGFGRSVGLDGDTALIGSASDDDAGAESGSAYAFVRSGTSWSQEAKLFAGDATAADRFGTAVALDGNTALVGAPGDDDAGSGSGSVYAFTASDPFPSFCDAADGSLAACPCSNPGDPDSGCDLPQATGGVRLDVLAQEYLPLNRATLFGVGYPPAATPAVVVLRALDLDPAAPVVFGDGLRCIGTPLVRLDSRLAIGGTSLHAIGHGAMGGSFDYQLWFRSQPAMFCTPDAFNLSNGRVLAW
jgi:FG-GAP repeat